MKYRVFYTRREQRALKAKGDFLAESELFEIVTVSDKDQLTIRSIWKQIEKTRKNKTGSDTEALNESTTLADLVKWAMASAKKFEPDCSPFEAYEVLNRREFPYPLEARSLRDFFDSAVRAILDGETGYFKALVKSINAVPQSSVNRLTDFAQNAYLALLQADGRIPTKKQVREKALRLNAVEDVKMLPQHRSAQETVQSNGEIKFSNEVENLIRAQIDTIEARQKWDRFWRLAGLADLPADPGGQPSHKKSKSRS